MGREGGIIGRGRLGEVVLVRWVIGSVKGGRLDSGGDFTCAPIKVGGEDKIIKV